MGHSNSSEKPTLHPELRQGETAHFAVPGLGMGWEDSRAVDMEPIWEYDEDVWDGVCGGGGGGVSDSVGGSLGVMGTSIDNCLGNGDIGCCCCPLGDG